MASHSSEPSPPSPPPSLHLKDKLHLNSILSLISVTNHHIHHLLSDPVARKSLHHHCTTNLITTTFNLSHNSLLSNLQHGIKNLERAIQCKKPENRATHLANSEKMLQFPALMEEEGTTSGISNRYIVCCTYFYLSLVRKLRGDEWQTTMYFLQSVLVNPGAVKVEFAPELWRRLFRPVTTDEQARKQARRYKDWLMYYQVVSYGEAPHWNEEKMKDFAYKTSGSSRCLGSAERDLDQPILQKDKLTIVLNNQVSSTSPESKDAKALLMYLDEDFDTEIEKSFNIKCIQDMLEESQSDSHSDSDEMSHSEVRVHNKVWPEKVLFEKADNLASSIGDRVYLAETSTPEASRYPMQVEAGNSNASYLLSSRSYSAISNLNMSIFDLRGTDSYSFSNCYEEEDETSPGRHSTQKIRCFRSFSSKFLVSRGSFSRKKVDVITGEKNWCEESSSYEKESQVELLGKFEKAVSNLSSTESLDYGKDLDFEVTTLWNLLNNNRPESKYRILDQIIDIISTTRKDKVIRASVSILLILISEDKTIVEGIKRKKSHLHYLASALKRNVYEAAIVIYLLNPSPSEIRSLEILPILVEAACNSNNYKIGPISLPLTPTAASIAMIEKLVTSFDYVTNNMHLAAISSPQILSKFVNVAMNTNLDEGIALTGILVRCMRLNGNCKKFLSQITPMDPFLHLLRSDVDRAKSAGLEYFHEILRIPRSSATNLLQQIRQQGGMSIMNKLTAYVQQSELDHRLLAANLLLQLDLLDGSNGKKMFREEAIKVLLETVKCEDDTSAQALAAFILSNLGGTYSWTGEPYTAAWLAKKTGLTSVYHKNMFRNIDWFDPCLQDSDLYAWSSKVARGVLKFGKSVFDSLAKGIQSKTRSVQHECLIAIAWLGSETAVVNRSTNLKYSACEILLSEVGSFLHPGSEFEDRILACLCIYNYTSGKGKQKLLNFSEGLRESLRRLSGVTWMAEELLKATEYLLPTQPRLSCVHTQILEIGHIGNGAATALIFYKGHLCAGYSDGFIKIWDIKGQKSALISEVKMHKKSITCFALSGTEDSLLSGSLDKTIRVWKAINRKLECTEVIEMKEPIQRIGSYGDKILLATQSKGLKVYDASRRIQTVCNNKHIKSLDVAQGKVYIGCVDSSIEEVDMIEDHKIEIKAPQKSWRRRSKPINSLVVYKGWVYCAGGVVEGSSTKEWRRNRKPQISIAMTRGTKVQAMAVVEDFIYLNCRSSPSVLQIWLREKQHKLGRLSAGSKITSLLTENDMVLCGSETGLIKGWIPL